MAHQRPVPVMTHGYSSRGVAAVRARRLFPSIKSGVRGFSPVRARRLFLSIISGVRGFSPVLPLGRKLDWQPGLGRASLDLAVCTHLAFQSLHLFYLEEGSTIAASHSPWLSCITLLRRTLLPRSIVYFHPPHWTVCSGAVGVVLSAKMSVFLSADVCSPPVSVFKLGLGFEASLSCIPVFCFIR